MLPVVPEKAFDPFSRLNSNCFEEKDLSKGKAKEQKLIEVSYRLLKILVKKRLGQIIFLIAKSILGIFFDKVNQDFE
jgi:hypothetical protein